MFSPWGWPLYKQTSCSSSVFMILCPFRCLVWTELRPTSLWECSSASSIYLSIYYIFFFQFKLHQKRKHRENQFMNDVIKINGPFWHNTWALYCYIYLNIFMVQTAAFALISFRHLDKQVYGLGKKIGFGFGKHTSTQKICLVRFRIQTNKDIKNLAYI